MVFPYISPDSPETCTLHPLRPMLFTQLLPKLAGKPKHASHSILASLAWGSRDDIRNEVARCMNAAKSCPGFIMAVGNHIPANVPMENAFYYFNLVSEMGKR